MLCSFLNMKQHINLLSVISLFLCLAAISLRRHCQKNIGYLVATTYIIRTIPKVKAWENHFQTQPTFTKLLSLLRSEKINSKWIIRSICSCSQKLNSVFIYSGSASKEWVKLTAKFRAKLSNNSSVRNCFTMKLA